ncbi:MAG: cation-translocating P-type ATPase, partial [Patescibacteria group bacterium]
KSTQAIRNKDVISADQNNMVFRGTNIVAGSGKAVVVATGIDTAIGKISQKIGEIEADIPLKKSIRRLSRFILVAAILISLVLGVFGLFKGLDWVELLKTIIAVCVSVIPEGLPIVITLILALGISRMSRKKVLVKKLQAVEALGQASLIAVDKTGTVTRNELMVDRFFFSGRLLKTDGEGYSPEGNILDGKAKLEKEELKKLAFFSRLCSLASRSDVVFLKREKIWRTIGDPTEAALYVLGGKLGINPEAVREDCPKLDEIPFDYRTKVHIILNNFGKENILIASGSPEEILKRSRRILLEGKETELDKKRLLELEEELESMLEDGLRVVALAFKKKPSQDFRIDPKEKDWILAGFVGMRDNLRKEVFSALRMTREAGIKVVMITGDHKITARAIAREAGIFKEGDEILTGEEISDWDDTELAQRLEKVSVFARVSPGDKLRIINAFQLRGEVVAMTGDGVNDALSLVAADLGVSMGKIGTEVAKEASDIVLLDDNFGSIVHGVEEGRSIYKNIKKVVLYLLSTSLGEVLTILAVLFLGYPLPVFAVQIIWLNLVTDGFLDIALAMENKENNLLKKIKAKSNLILDKLLLKRMIFMGAIMAFFTSLAFIGYFKYETEKAWTVSLTLLAVFQWFNAWNCRTEKHSLFSLSLWANKFLFGATAIVVALQLLAVYHPFFQKFLKTVPLEGTDWAVIIPLGFSIILLEEIRKFLARRKNRSISVSIGQAGKNML